MVEKMELLPTVQKYEWGKPGTSSAVAQLYKASKPDLVIDETPFAELWMGTHPSGPSKIKSSGEALSETISKNIDCLGAKSIEIFGNELPFLFKVLSVNKALSIQAHPSKSHAEKLHAARPDIYKDPNHKPELAIALTSFKAMCGFRPAKEIQKFFKDITELREVVGNDNASKFIDSAESDILINLRLCFKAMMTCPDDKIKIQLDLILGRFKNLNLSDRQLQLSNLIETLHSQFPGDVGCFAPYFLNVLDLQPGQAIFLGPNEPHAYLQGDCIECMACSDNVVRAGLTPKFKDVETLCAMLIYDGEPAPNKFFQPIQEDQYTLTYKPPVDDFAVAKINIPAGSNKVDLIKRNIASILLCIEGDAKYNTVNIKTGSVLFVPANELVSIANIKSNVVLYQAMANL